MKPLDYAASNHPLLTGVVGVSSSLSSWLLAKLHFVAGIIADVSILVSFAAGVLTVMILLRNWKRGRRLERNREERRKFWADEPFDEQHLERHDREPL